MWVIKGCELPCGCWESNPSPLQEQSAFLTPLSSLYCISLFCVYRCFAYMHVCELSMCSAHRGHKRASGTMKLEY